MKRWVRFLTKMTDHTITAYEPRLLEIHLEYIDGEVEETYRDSVKPQNWKAMSVYVCECGEEFDERKQAEEHLKDAE